MKILLVNKFHYLKGGSEKYYFELAQLLKDNGHEVAFFSMENDKNIKTGEKEYFVKEIDLNTGSKLKALDVIYSNANKKAMEYALDEFKPDIVHLNNFQRQLSASIIWPIKKKNIPIVYTAHDVQAICPAITMMDNDKNICEKCMKGKYVNCIKKKCNKNSTLKSIIGALEGFFYRYNKIYTKKIDKIITPSTFYKKKMIEDGIPKEKIVDIHNFIDVKQYETTTTNENYGLYIGRLSKEKGIINLINAFAKLEEGALYIAGEGPEKEKIQNIIQEKGLQHRVKLLGFLTSEQVIEKVSKCRFVVVPSIWYENCPYSILETLSIGKPVIGANIAGIPELVKDNKNGLLYDFTDTEQLAKKMEILYGDKELALQMSARAKTFAKEEFDKKQYYNKLIQIYKDLIKERKK